MQTARRVAIAACALLLVGLSSAGSSSLSPPDPAAASWSPAQATGAADTPNAGDHATAWATLTADSGEEWLELSYAHAMRIAQVRIHENNAPGAVARVAAIVAGEEVTLWHGVAPPVVAPNVFAVEALEAVKCDRIRVYLDTARIPGWNEIDAVELVATDG